VKILIIGATGHTGGYLTRDLLDRGHAVLAVTRGRQEPLLAGAFWDRVERVEMDRKEAERDGRLAALIDDQKPGAVVDIMCYTSESAEAMLAALAGRNVHLVHVGTAWVYGAAGQVPTPETFRGEPLNDYARRKLAIQDRYLERSGEEGATITVVNPTQITGPGKPFITPEATNDVAYLRRMRDGEPVPLPGFGTGLVQHVHASDVARVMALAIEYPDRAGGQVYNASSAYALTYRRLFDLVRERLGSACDPQPMSLDDYQAAHGPNETVRQHLIQPTCVDIRKAAAQLGYEPAYTPEAAVADALDDLVRRGRLDDA
jgi:nucleoside-diphosphate-sugar epimerase